MWIAILVTVGAIAMALGPVMMIAPSKSQKRIAKLRSYANAHGLQVRLRQAPQGAVVAGHEGQAIAQYFFPWKGREDNKKRLQYQTWCLVKTSYEHDIHFRGVWQWANQDKAPASVQPLLQQVLSSLPDDVIALQADTHGLSFYWWETAEVEQLQSLIEVVGSIKAALETLAAPTQL